MAARNGLRLKWAGVDVKSFMSKLTKSRQLEFFICTNLDSQPPEILEAFEAINNTIGDLLRKKPSSVNKKKNGWFDHECTVITRKLKLALH